MKAKAHTIHTIDTATRDAGLRQMLTDRRRELHGDVQSRLRDGRIDRPSDAGDAADRSDADVQGDIDLGLLQMKSGMLIHIDQALVRLDAGQYGSCFECAGAIAERRLRALPFAVRCQACAERREQRQGHARRLDQRRGSLSLFPEAVPSSPI